MSSHRLERSDATQCSSPGSTLPTTEEEPTTPVDEKSVIQFQDVLDTDSNEGSPSPVGRLGLCGLSSKFDKRRTFR